MYSPFCASNQHLGRLNGYKAMGRPIVILISMCNRSHYITQHHGYTATLVLLLSLLLCTTRPSPSAKACLQLSPDGSSGMQPTNRRTPRPPKR
ncbi:hypothetical protein CFE70_001836 [Pyrenophora teres f. teres 0-1]